MEVKDDKEKADVIQKFKEDVIAYLNARIDEFENDVEMSVADIKITLNKLKSVNGEVVYAPDNVKLKLVSQGEET